MAKPEDNKTINGCIDWLKEYAASTRYGEVGIAFIIHDGRITKVIKKIEEKNDCQRKEAEYSKNLN